MTFLKSAMPFWVEIELKDINQACGLLLTAWPDAEKRWLYYGSYFGKGLFMFADAKDALWFKMKV